MKIGTRKLFGSYHWVTFICARQGFGIGYFETHFRCQPILAPIVWHRSFGIHNLAPNILALTNFPLEKLATANLAFPIWHWKFWSQLIGNEYSGTNYFSPDILALCILHSGFWHQMASTRHFGTQNLAPDI